MAPQDFGITKRSSTHSDLTDFVFNQRTALMITISLLTLVAIYLEVGGVILSSGKESMLVGVGLFFVLTGLYIRLWASLYIVNNRNRKLVSFGPYSIVRNPLYLGNFVAVLGAMIFTGSVTAILICMGGMAFVYYFTIKYEDGRLEQHFPEEFPAFRDRVPRMIPSLANFNALVAKEEFDTVSYNNVKKELFRALQALVVVGLLLGYTIACRQGVF